jgi:hypothetical protein
LLIDLPNQKARMSLEYREGNCRIDDFRSPLLGLEFMPGLP